MTRNMLTLRAAPLMSAIFMRHEVTREEKEQILSSVESEPGCKQRSRFWQANCCMTTTSRTWSSFMTC